LNFGEIMNKADLRHLREWFKAFCRSYYLQDRGEQMNIELKERHSYHVAENARLIAQGEAMNGGDQLLAETAGLFHDVGRFPQYARYKTFRDAISVNHGVLGADTLEKTGALDCVEQSEREIIVKAVRYHNALAVPAEENGHAGVFMRLVRDADKLDIWRVFCEYYEGGEESGADAVPLGLPDLPGYSREALEAIMHRGIVRLGQVKTLTDLKLLQLSWVFDINFKASFRLAADRGIIQRMVASIAKDEDILRAVAAVDAYVGERAAGC
jgi:putative nucleotidyltransferase with HDIG domain